MKPTVHPSQQILQRSLGDHHAQLIPSLLADFAKYQPPRFKPLKPCAIEQPSRSAYALKGSAMPTLSLRIAPLHNPSHYAALARELTALTARVLHKRPEVTVVMIDDLPAARFCVSGVASKQPIACLEIDITQGTNTMQEKQQFVHEAHELLTRLLGDLHEASYVIVRELPSSDWGFDGLTQAQRHAMTRSTPQLATA
jgi:4-oxalocrotonate tautomerase